jgi:hypothetical protein
VASQTDIINLGLYKLAQSQTIPAITDQSKAATIAVRVWQHALDLVLSDRPWGFATKSQSAALDVDAPSPGWGYRYSYPNDCLRLWKLVQRQDLLTNPSLSFWAGYEWPLSMRLLYGWNTAWGTQGTCIDANLDEAVLIYVVRLTEADTERLPPHFVEALAAKLAQMMAAPLIGDVGLNASTTLEQGYQFALARASAFDGNQGLEQDEQTPSMLARS